MFLYIINYKYFYYLFTFYIIINFYQYLNLVISKLLTNKIDLYTKNYIWFQNNIFIDNMDIKYINRKF